MATQIVKRTPARMPAKLNNQDLGVSPTKQQKLLYIASKLGLNLTGMQGTSRNLYDTIVLATGSGASRQTLNFFANTNGKSLNFSNFQDGTLNTGETLMIEKVKFLVLTLTSDALNDDANIATLVNPFSSASSAQIQRAQSLQTANMDISIANSIVTKAYQINEVNPVFNRRTTGISLNAVPDGAAGSVDIATMYGNNTVEMDSPPVIPMQQKFTLSLNLPPIGTIGSHVAIMCVVGDFGSIYASKTTY